MGKSCLMAFVIHFIHSMKAQKLQQSPVSVQAYRPAKMVALKYLFDLLQCCSVV